MHNCVSFQWLCIDYSLTNYHAIEYEWVYNAFCWLDFISIVFGNPYTIICVLLQSCVQLNKDRYTFITYQLVYQHGTIHEYRKIWRHWVWRWINWDHCHQGGRWDKLLQEGCVMKVIFLCLNVVIHCKGFHS